MYDDYREESDVKLTGDGELIILKKKVQRYHYITTFRFRLFLVIFVMIGVLAGVILGRGTSAGLPLPAQSVSNSSYFSQSTPEQVALRSGSADRRGMTWGTGTHDGKLGIDLVSCHGQPSVSGGSSAPSCDAYQGDASCSATLPMLCLKPENLPRPNYAVGADGSETAASGAYYAGWAGGHIQLTIPIRGDQLRSLTQANSLCVDAFGSGYRMAGFHDGKYVDGMGTDQSYGDGWPSPDKLQSGGWAWYAYGNIPEKSRFWVYIDDQSANCWN